MQQKPRIWAEPTVLEGGTLVVRARSEVKEISVFIPGHGSFLIGVRHGRAELTLPPNVRGGAQLIVSDLLVPTPCSLTVDVVGTSQP